MPTSKTFVLGFSLKATPLTSPIASGGLALSPQLAYNPDIANLDDFYSYARKMMGHGDLVAEQKYDGVRGQCIIKLNKSPLELCSCEFRSRINRYLPSCQWLADSIKANPELARYLVSTYGYYDYLILDGELIVPNQEFRTINGIVNRQSDCPEIHTLKFVPFQIYFADQHGSAMHTLSYNHRDLLIELLSKYTPQLLMPRLKIIKTILDLEALYDDLVVEHAEGFILKSSDHRHFDGRTRQWLKYKFRRMGTFLLTRVIAGEGKCLGYAGAIEVADQNNYRTLVGTGFTDSIRRELSSLDLSKHRYLVDINYMTKTGDSLREASFKAIRYDLVDAPDWLGYVDKFETR